MYAISLTNKEFGPFIENLPGDRKIEAYATGIHEDKDTGVLSNYHSLVISGQKPQE